MSIIQTKFLAASLTFLLILFNFNLLFSDDKNLDSNLSNKHKTFALSIYVSSGVSTLLNYSEGNKSRNINKRNFFYLPSLKIMWNTNTLLNIGIESAFITIMKDQQYNQNTDFGITNFEALMTALPISLIFDMNIWKFNLYAGFGAAYIESYINAFDDNSSSSIIAGNYIYGLEYFISLTERLKVGLEAKLYYITSINKYLPGACISIGYDVFRW